MASISQMTGAARSIYSSLYSNSSRMDATAALPRWGGRRARGARGRLGGGARGHRGVRLLAGGGGQHRN